MIESVLIANRGEIAIRVIRAAREMGLRTIAVYSEIDRNAPHVSLAHEAWNIGPAPAADSYLNIDRIIEVVTESEAASVHPGYGFLAENAGFAQAVLDAGAIWIGPPPAAIAVMGDKIASRKAAADAGVYGVPGTLDPIDGIEEVEAFAEEHGFPVAIKAAHGGGGKGLKVVRSVEEIRSGFESAQREADAYFRNPAVYVERYLDRPRHIEAQIMADQHGAVRFIGERDCSLQRRHQKLVEEAPAHDFSQDLRKDLAEASVAVAKAADYVSAGTVEFLLDGDALYFLEMNTRIQVEHTVTELVTGLDLVKEQIRIAGGEPLSFDTVEVRGHAIEMRINAEDPSTGFLPAPGTIVDYREPGGLGVRVDSGVVAGSLISQYYDNLVAKLVVWGEDREEAIARALRALDEFTVTGIATTIPALARLLATDEFRRARHWTRFIDDVMDFSDIEMPGTGIPQSEEELEERSITVEVGGRRYSVKYWAPVMTASLSGGQRLAPRRRPPKLERTESGAASAGVVTAPMQGTIVKVHHAAGEAVKTGDPVCVLEAMKMENEITAPIDGEIIDLRVQPGDAVATGAVMLVIQ